VVRLTGISTEIDTEEVGMPPVRVVVQFTADSASTAEQRSQELAERAKTVRQEPGCLQFEVFRSVSRPEQYALVELWESQEVLDNRARTRGGPLPPPPAGVTRVIEHYEHHPDS
jgi:quinol monooxygenase YgiN